MAKPGVWCGLWVILCPRGRHCCLKAVRLNTLQRVMLFVDSKPFGVYA